MATHLSRVVRRAFAACVALLGLLVSLSSAHAEAYKPPPLNGHVVDGSSTLTPDQIASLDAKLTALRERTGFAIVVFIPGTLEGQTIEDVAYDTFNAWQVGEKEKDNGVLLVLAPSERKSRIETGKGVGGELTDLESVEILRTYVTPAMKDGDLYRADAGSEAIATALTGDLPTTTTRPRTVEREPVSPFTRWIFLGGVGLILLLAIVSPKFRWVLLGILQGILMSRGGGRGGGGFSGGGGGYSGGGGRSGGGGASDSY